MKVNRKLSYGILSILILMFTLGFVSALNTATLVSPAASASASGTTTLNSSLTGYSFDPTATLVNITWYAMSSSTANSSWVVLNSSGNVNLTSSNFTTATFNSALIEDSNDYVLNVTYTNSTSGALYAADTNIAVIIDNTVPTAASALLPTEDTDGSVTFTSTVVGSRTTGCTLVFSSKNPGSSSYAMTHSGNTCSKTVSSVPEESYSWYVTASDGTNTTDSTAQTTRVDVKTSAGKAALLASQGAQATGNGNEFLAATDTNGGIGSLSDFLGMKILGIPLIILVFIIIIIILIVKKSRR